MNKTVSIGFPDFFPPESMTANVARSLHHAPPLAPIPQNILVYGPQNCGKTTILFHLAYSLASKGAAVLIIAMRDRLEFNPPRLARGLTPNHPPWSRIQIKYIEDESSLLEFASHIHCTPYPPSVVLIDDIDDMVQGRHHSAADSIDKDGTISRDAALCRVLAVLCDSLEYVSTSRGGAIKTLLACTASLTGTFTEVPRSFHLLQRWLPLALRCFSTATPHENSGVSPPTGGNNTHYPLSSKSNWTKEEGGSGRTKNTPPPQVVIHRTAWRLGLAASSVTPTRRMTTHEACMGWSVEYSIDQGYEVVWVSGLQL